MTTNIIDKDKLKLELSYVLDCIEDLDKENELYDFISKMYSIIDSPDLDVKTIESKIDTLQRYFLVEYNVHENKYQEGKSEYIRYDDLKKLLLQSDTESI